MNVEFTLSFIHHAAGDENRTDGLVAGTACPCQRPVVVEANLKAFFGAERKKAASGAVAMAIAGGTCCRAALGSLVVATPSNFWPPQRCSVVLQSTFVGSCLLSKCVCVVLLSILWWMNGVGVMFMCSLEALLGIAELFL